MPREDLMGLEAERLWLRPWDEADLSCARPIFTDADVMRYINGGLPLADDEIQKFIVRQHNYLHLYGFCLWKLLLKPESVFAGFCGLQPLELDGRREVEIGWRLVRERWNCGLATEAAQTALDDAVERARLTRVVAIAMPENRASLRVMEKLGMKFERSTHNGIFGVVMYARNFSHSRNSVGGGGRK